MNANDFEKLSDGEMLRRIYTAQLRMMMDIEQIHENIIAIRKKVDEKSFDPEQVRASGDNPYGFRHLTEIHETFDDMFRDFPRQLNIDKD